MKLSQDTVSCDSTTIRLRYDDTTTHSTTTEVIEIINLRKHFQMDYVIKVIIFESLLIT